MKRNFVFFFFLFSPPAGGSVYRWILSSIFIPCLLISSLLFSQIPQTLSYQGVLKDASGNITPNGTYNLTFRLYSTSTGGNALWTELQAVPVADGVFNVILGSTVVITLPFDVPYWLGITVGTGSELTPRIRLTSAAYSLNSNSVVNNAVTTAKIADGAVTQTKLAPGVSLPPGGTAGGDLTGSYPNPSIANNAVSSSKISNGAVTLPKISSSGASTGNILTYDGSNLVWQTPASGGIGGSGTANTLPVFVTSNTLGNSNVYYSGNFIGIGASPENFDSRLLVRTNLQFGGTPPTYLARFMTRSEYLPFNYLDQAYIETDGDAYIRGKLSVGDTAGLNATLYCYNPDGDDYGVYSITPDGYGIYGVGGGTSGRGVVGSGHLNGGYFSSSNASATAVRGIIENMSGTNYGVRGAAGSSNGYALYGEGRFAVTGTKSFQMDHPLDPENKYLNHYCTEGAEPLNAYSGNVVLDTGGEAVIELPPYFELINKDFRYQLTCIGIFAPVYIADKIKNNRFKISGGQPGMEVSWRVEAVRNDRWVERYGAPVETEKPEGHRGKYLNPELYGQPESMGVFYESDRPAPDKTGMNR